MQSNRAVTARVCEKTARLFQTFCYKTVVEEHYSEEVNKPQPPRPPKPRYVAIDRAQLSWREFDVDQLIGPDHSARAIWTLVGRLQLGAFEAEIQSVEEHSGRPSWPPQLLISVWIYGYSLGISSARALERMMGYEPGLRWLCASETINHHTLSDFRVSGQAALQTLFSEVLALLEQEGLVELSSVMQDGTKLRSVAGKESLRREATIDKRLAAARQWVQEMGEREEAEGEDRRRQAALERAAREQVERMERALEELHARQAEVGADKRAAVRVSVSEPEARKMKHADGAWAPSYNVQVSTEAKSRIVVAVGVTQEVNDVRQLEAAMQSIQANTGQKLERLIADNGYTSRSNVEAAAAGNVQLIAPWKEDRARAAGARARHGIDAQFAASVFRREAGGLLCPAEKLLVPVKTVKHHGVPRTTFAASPEDCGTCPWQTRCCGPRAAVRQVHQVVESSAMQNYLERMKQPETETLYKKRGEVAEFPHLWTKAIRGLRRFRVRGLVKVEKEAIWMAIAYNVQQWTRLSRSLAV